MSTLKTNLTAQRILQLTLLARTGKELFHVAELGGLWGIENPNTLRITLNRYSRAGLLHRIYRGFYSLLPPEKINPIDLGLKALHRFAYLSTESGLFEAGFIAQPPSAFTLVSEISLSFKIYAHRYKVRQLKDHYLYQTEELITEKNILKATPYRAIVELLYFNPYASIDRPVDWKKIRALQSKWGYPLTPHRYANS